MQMFLNKRDNIRKAISNQNSSMASCVKTSCQWRQKIIVEVVIDSFI